VENVTEEESDVRIVVVKADTIRAWGTSRVQKQYNRSALAENVQMNKDLNSNTRLVGFETQTQQACKERQQQAKSIDKVLEGERYKRDYRPINKEVKIENSANRN
jgi:hypothetical protein